MKTSRDELQQRMMRLLEFTEAARTLQKSDTRIILLNQQFIDNFSSALDVEPDNMEQLENNTHIRWAHHTAAGEQHVH